MKKLLLVTTILLSTATRNIDAKITDTPMTSSGGDPENSDYSERQVWWKREKRKKSGSARADPSETSFSFLPFAESVESSALSTLIRYLDTNGRPGSSQNDLRKSIGKEYLRYRIANPLAATSFAKFWKPFEKDESYFASCDSRKACSYRRQQGWEVQEPFYVEEPSWIKIDNDLSRTTHRLDVTDPFVISRGKKVRGVDHSTDESPKKHGNIYVLVRDRFADETNRKLKFENEKTYQRNDGNENDEGDENRRKVSRNTTERENTEGGTSSKHRAENEMFHVRSNKFHPSKYADRSVENAILDESDSVLFLDRKKRDRNFADHDILLDIARNKLAYGTNRCLLLEQPCFPPTDKMDGHRLDYALLEKPKSKRTDPNSYSNLDGDLDTDSLIGRSVAKDVLERLIENLECDSNRCTDQSGRTMKRTRLADGRGILEHLLAKSDPFYVARGKRVSRNVLDPPVDSTDTIYENGRNL